MGRMGLRLPGKTFARQRRRMSYRVVGVGSAVVLAAGLLSILIVPAAAKTAAPHPRIAAPRSPAKAWARAPQPVRAQRSTRRAPFLSWSKHKSLSAASIVHTYRVTTTADTTPASCPATVSEPCTLRQAVMQANTDGTLDKIQVPAAASPYLLETDQLTITDTAGVVIAGAGQAKTVVEADSTSPSYPFRVLQISNGSPVQVSNVTVKDGDSTSPAPTPRPALAASVEDGYGGGIEVLSGSLTMRNSTVTGNFAENQGGGIYVAGLNSVSGSSGTESQAYLKNVTISDNDAGNGGGGLDVEGQAIMQGAITANIGGELGGGGILLDDDGTYYPSLSASKLTVSGNRSLGEGGGIANYGSLALTGGVVGGSSNADGNSSQPPRGRTFNPQVTSQLRGGGIFNRQVATLHNVAVLHNKALYGGGIENDDRVSVIGGSLSHNRAQDAAGLDNESGQATLTGVKVAGNHAVDQAGGIGNVGPSSGLSVSGGSITNNTAPQDGGGILSIEPASVAGTSVTGNTADGGDGGGIYSSAPLTLTGVQLGTAAQPNAAQLGGGLYTDGTGATIVRSTIAGNQARDAGNGAGGGIFNLHQADDELRQTTLTGNSSDSAGGGILNYGATMSILTSTLSGNQVIAGAAEAFGGGISNVPNPSFTPTESATLKMVNDSLTGNRAGGGSTAGFGGGLDNESQASAVLTNVTVSRNRAGSTGTGGGIYNNGVAALRGSILAGNTAAHAHDNCGLPVALSSNGYNLSTDGTCGLNGIGDQVGVNPLLGPLAHNGGPTETEALKAGSPAIDAVKFCPPPKTDQRGVNRQGPCDVGAYERVPDR
jgi:hypothetical protein